MIRVLFVVCIALAPSSSRAEFKRLYSETATASSHLQTNWNRFEENYHPNYALDDDPKTAWVEGVEGDGIGESISVRLSSLRKAKTLKLVLFTGYQKSKGLFAANGVPTRVTVTVKGAGGETSGTAQLELKPVMGPQTFTVPLDGGLRDVTVRIDAVKKGATYADTVLSDMQFFVDSEVPYDARVEQGRRTRLITWKKERFASAATFKKLPVTYPFAGSSFGERSGTNTLISPRWSKVTDEEVGVPNPKFIDLPQYLASSPQALTHEDTALMREVLEAANTRGRWYSMATRPAVRLPEGLEGVLPDAVLPMLRVADVTLFESKSQKLEQGPLRASTGIDGPSREVSISNVQLLEGTAQQPVRVLLRQREVVYERSDFETTTWVLVEWKDGLIARVATFEQESSVSGGTRNLELDGVEGKVEVPPERTDLLRVSTVVIRVITQAGKIAALEVKALDSRTGNEMVGVTEEDGLSLRVARWSAQQ